MTFLHPRYWPLWVGIALLWSFIHFPYRWQLTIGRFIGRIAFRLASRRRKIADINLKLCFPRLNNTQRRQLLRQHFESLGMGLLEMVGAWWLPNAALKPHGHVQGLEHLYTALERGKGVILLGAHFTSMEIGLRFLTMRAAIYATYRPHENPLIEHIIKKSRESRAEKTIPRHAVREMLRSLKQNKTLWIAIDQNFGHKHSVFANFFDIPAATNTVISRLAHISGAAIVPIFIKRLNHHQGYQVILQPALAHFPSEDRAQDALRINQLIEAQTVKAPEQYLWVHRRFKTRPKGEEDIYF